MQREFGAVAERSGHAVDVEFQEFGLHRTPDELREQTQQAIDRVPEGEFDYILLGYGICSRGLAGIIARHTPLVIPRAHDCITLLLGSRERYGREFAEYPGTYYYSSGWIERAGALEEDGQYQSQKHLAERQHYLEYVEKYGEDNAQFLIEQESAWALQYSRAVLINTGLGAIDQYRAFTREIARSNDWEYVELRGDDRLMGGLVEGDWSEDEFLVVPPGQMTAESYDAGILRAVPAPAEARADCG